MTNLYNFLHFFQSWFVMYFLQFFFFNLGYKVFFLYLCFRPLVYYVNVLVCVSLLLFYILIIILFNLYNSMIEYLYFLYYTYHCIINDTIIVTFHLCIIHLYIQCYNKIIIV